LIPSCYRFAEECVADADGRSARPVKRGKLGMLTSAKAIVVAAVLAVVGATGASAVTVSFNTFVSGADLGNVELASLNATQNGTAVDFTLSAAFLAQPTSYIDYLRLNYSGTPLPTSATNTGGVTFASFSTGSFTDASYGFNIDFDYPNSNSGGGILRLNPGEFSSFSIANADLNLFDFSSFESLIHVNALFGGDSTKYTTAAPIPLPAAGLLLLCGLGSLGGLGLTRRKRAA
jgi:hypothetical protein